VGVKSGSPPTCDENTHTNGFEEYCALKECFVFLTAWQIFQLIGPKFGDDGLTRKELKKYHTKICDQLGLKVKYEPCLPDTGVTFLARVYPDPWTTSTTFQDPLRTWRKLHLTARDPNVPLETAALDRLEGYLQTDFYSPVTSDYCNMIKRCYQEKVDGDLKRGDRLSKDREKTYWLTQGGAWPQDHKDRDLMLNCMSARTGFSVENLEGFVLHLQQLNNPWALSPMNREEEPNPYKDTLDHDALPAEPLDARQLLSDEQNKCLRANPETTRCSGVNHDGTHPPTPGPSSGGRSDTARPPKLRGLPANDQREARQGSGRTNVKATRGVGPQRGTNSNRSQPPRTNQGAEARVERARGGRTGGSFRGRTERNPNLS